MRVVDTPITELGFAGVGVGAAMAGLRPIIEFMTWNFALLALDQVVNAAAKMLYMSGGQFPMPIVFRGPNGAALQLGAQHSQAWESWLAHIPGLKVVAPGTPYDAKGLLKAAIRDDNPVCFLEGEMLYNTKGEVPDGDYVIPLGKADLKREGEHCTLITHGKMVLVAMQAADQLAKEGIRCDVVDLRTIRPMDVDAITESVRKTNRARGRGRRLGGVRRGCAGGGLRAARTASITSMRRCCACTRPTPRCRTPRVSRRPRSPTSRRRSRPSSKSCTSTEPHMATKVMMEALSPTMEEGRLVKWLRNVGDP